MKTTSILLSFHQINASIIFGAPIQLVPEHVSEKFTTAHFDQDSGPILKT